MSSCEWEPPDYLSGEQVIRMSEEALGRPRIPYSGREEITRVRAVGMDWDIACKVYEPDDPDLISTGADGKKAGIFILHGGASDHRQLEPLAPILTGGYGYKTVFMTFPGRFYFHAEDRNWPGDTINADGTARTPLWTRETRITADQYELVRDRSDIKRREKWGTLFFLRAREGTEFYHRMAGWPVAFEEGMKSLCRRFFPPGEFSIYVHGHSTGGPFACILLQRVENVAGLVGTEGSPFGYIVGEHNARLGLSWTHPFNYLVLRTWRHIAKYAGPESGADGMRRLPMLMEEVLEEWHQQRRQPQFKAEYIVHYGVESALTEAALVTAERLKLSGEDTQELVRRYVDYTRPLSGPGTRPVPPLLLGIAAHSVDHTFERYSEVDLPMFAALRPAPRVRLTRFGLGVHNKLRPEEGLPMGIGPAVCHLWHDAIQNGYYVV
ncbi:MAG: hypothetical protein R6U70_08470 [Bacillota bacterium]